MVNSNLFKLAFFSFGILFFHSLESYAIPSRIEAYRSDRLHTIVYKDSQDAETFWYVPPIKLLERDGKIVSYKRNKDGKVLYTFYLVPFMTKDMIEVLTGEINGFTNRSQLKPVPVQKFGLKLEDFNASFSSEIAANYQYLNTPQLVKVKLPESDVEDFEFFLNNQPGVPVQVLFTYESEKLDKYLSIELNYKEISDALKVGANGKYKFTKAEIEYAVSNYVGKKYLNIKSKGELQMPEIIKKVLEECFTPATKNGSQKIKPSMALSQYMLIPGSSAEIQENLDLLNSLEIGIKDGEDDKHSNKGKDPKDDSDGGDSEEPKTKNPSLEFVFKKELINSDKSFYYKQEQYADASETVSIPSFLSLISNPNESTKEVQPLGKWELTVTDSNSSSNMLYSNIMIGEDEQFTITSGFSYWAKSIYADGVYWYRWDSNWPSADEELYYRVGSGPWTRVNGRTVVKTDNIFYGELQFYIDKKAWYSKIPERFRVGSLWGTLPPIFSYSDTHPQFKVTVSGKKVKFFSITKP